MIPRPIEESGVVQEYVQTADWDMASFLTFLAISQQPPPKKKNPAATTQQHPTNGAIFPLMTMLVKGSTISRSATPESCNANPPLQREPGLLRDTSAGHARKKWHINHGRQLCQVPTCQWQGGATHQLCWRWQWVHCG